MPNLSRIEDLQRKEQEALNLRNWHVRRVLELRDKLRREEDDLSLADAQLTHARVALDGELKPKTAPATQIRSVA